MKTKIFYLVILLCINYFSVDSQNLINTSSWTVGSGSVSGFGQHGETSENNRELGSNSQGNSVLLWKASPNSNGGSSGGFNTDFFNIDNKKTYRFAIWIKKTNSNDGSSLFGSLSNSNTILNLDGTTQSSPYFLIGDLPQLNKWYLLVGYIHGSNYDSVISYGAIYDGGSGQKTHSLTDFKFDNNPMQNPFTGFIFPVLYFSESKLT